MSRKLIDNSIKVLIWLSALFTVGILLWILLYITINSIGVLNWNFVVSGVNNPQDGIFPMIVATLYLVVLTLVISAPIGVFAAIYLVEYAKPSKLVEVIRFATETLAGIPSIIYGLFGMILLVTIFELGFSLISGAITLSIMVLPTIIRTTEEALKSVPDSYREGSLALGATKLTTIFKIVLPSAIPGVLTSIILSIGRIVGETAAVYLTVGMFVRVPSSITHTARTLSVHLFILAKEGISFEKAFATATVLMVVVGMVNLVANKICASFRKI